MIGPGQKEMHEPLRTDTVSRLLQASGIQENHRDPACQSEMATDANEVLV